MIHLGKNTKSKIISKGISAGQADNTYRGLVSVHPKAIGSKNFTQCDSLLVGNKCGAHTVPYIENKKFSLQKLSMKQQLQKLVMISYFIADKED